MPLQVVVVAAGTTSSEQTEDSVAEVNGKYYTDFLEAVAATYNNPNSWCTLLENITVNGDVGQDYNNGEPVSWQINLNGDTLKCNTVKMNGAFIRV